MKPIHDRMPVIIRHEDIGLWLDVMVRDTSVLSPLMRPVEDDYLTEPRAAFCLFSGQISFHSALFYRSFTLNR